MRRARESSFVVLAVLVALGLLLAACGGDDDDSSNSKSDAVLQATGGKVTIQGHDVYYNAKEIDASAGPLEVTLENEGAQQHTFTIDSPKFRIQATPGNSKSGTIDLPPGRYQYYCDIPGHRATMNGTLVVK
jgi:plastocyanin